MIKFYVFVEAMTDKAGDAFETIRKIPEVETVDFVMGAYDLVVVARVDSLKALGDLLSDKIQSLEDVVRTSTMVAVGV